MAKLIAVRIKAHLTSLIIIILVISDISQHYFLEKPVHTVSLGSTNQNIKYEPLIAKSQCLNVSLPLFCAFRRFLGLVTYFLLLRSLTYLRNGCSYSVQCV